MHAIWGYGIVWRPDPGQLDLTSLILLSGERGVLKLRGQASHDPTCQTQMLCQEGVVLGPPPPPPRTQRRNSRLLGARPGPTPPPLPSRPLWAPPRLPHIGSPPCPAGALPLLSCDQAVVVPLASLSTPPARRCPQLPASR